MKIGGGARREVAPTPVRADVLKNVCHNVGIDTKRITRVVRRFKEGADLGFGDGVGTGFITNNRSATRHKREVSAALREEVAAGVTKGPFPAPPLPNFRVNPLSARIKPSGKARVILDLSAPHGASVNDEIDPDTCAVQQASLDQLTELIFEHGGAGTRLFKADIRAAFKLIPVRPEQHHALGFFFWESGYWYQTALQLPQIPSYI